MSARTLVGVALGMVAPCWLAAGASAQAQVDRAGSNLALASSYRATPGDELEVYVWGEERLQRAVKVLPDGTFAFPLAGQVVAQGKTLPELEAVITDRLRNQYRGQVPQVTVSVKVPSGLQFSVVGRVNSPGSFTPGRYVTVLEALSLAGGATEFANLDSILVIRKAGDRLVPIRVQLARLFRAGAGAADISSTNILRLEPGDTVIVP